ncbi:MAG: hypothetical protein AAF527_03225, partial [Pseudomonadota bacterium]
MLGVLWRWILPTIAFLALLITSIVGVQAIYYEGFWTWFSISFYEEEPSSPVVDFVAEELERYPLVGSQYEVIAVRWYSVLENGTKRSGAGRGAFYYLATKGLSASDLVQFPSHGAEQHTQLFYAEQGLFGRLDDEI